MLEKAYPDYMRHTFATHGNIRRSQKAIRSLKQKVASRTKHAMLARIGPESPKESLLQLGYLRELAQAQEQHLKSRRLTPKRHADEPVRPRSLLYHFPLLETHFGKMFTGLKGAIILEDSVDSDQLLMATSCLIDAAHLEQLKIVLQQQGLLCNQLCDHVHSGRSQFLGHGRKILLQSMDEELFRVANLIHQKSVVEPWM